MTDKPKQQEKALIIGDLPQAYLDEYEITSDLELAEDRLNIHLERIPAEEVMARVARMSRSGQEEASALAQRLVEGATLESPYPVPLSEVEKSAQMYVVLKEMLGERNAMGITMDCRPFFRDGKSVLPCAVLTLLQDDGLVAACQVDLDAFLTMLLLKRITPQPTFMGGPLEHDGLLALSHCAMPLRMAGEESPPQSYCLGGHHGTPVDPTLRTSLPVGTAVTIARLTRNLESLIIATGTVVDSRGEVEGSPCCNTLLVQVPDLDALLPAIKGFQYHLVAACGNYRVGLERLARKLEIHVIP